MTHLNASSHIHVYFAAVSLARKFNWAYDMERQPLASVWMVAALLGRSSLALVSASTRWGHG
jgi:hypothetical protein